MKTSKKSGRGKKIAVSILALSLLSQSFLGSFTAFAQEDNAANEFFAAGNVHPDEALWAKAQAGDEEAAAELNALKIARDEASKTKHNLDAMSSILTSTTYAEYNQINVKEGREKATQTFVLDAVNYNKEMTDEYNSKDTESTGKSVSIKEKGYVEGWDTESLLMYDDGRVYWDIEVPESGLYTITAEYFPIVEEDGVKIGNTSSIERILLIDDKVPFNEARYITFTRNWVENYDAEGYVKPNQFWKTGKDLTDADNDEAIKFTAEQASINNGQYTRDPGRYFKHDYYNNEIRPKKIEAPKAMTQAFKDANEFYAEPFEFYLEKGHHTFALDSSREPILFKSFTFAPLKEIVSYDEYAEAHKSHSAADTDNIVKLDAEFMKATSEQVIYPLNDRTSPISDPQHSSAIRLNTIGGEKWQLAGQWVEWEFQVPADGLYYIIPRYMQNVNAGLFSSRKIYINGEEPFKEARNIRFGYSDEWTTKPLGFERETADGKTEYENFKFYFEAGQTYTIKMEVVLGDMGEVILEINESLQRMNEYYRKILMITGTQPDTYLDYNFDNLIPDVLSGMRNEQKILENASARLEELVGEKGDQSVTLDKIAYLLDIMGNDQDKVAGNLSNFKSYIGTLGTWLLTARNQPLTLDYMLVVPAKDDFYCPNANAGFFKNMQHEFSAFMNSFFTNYNSVGATEELNDKEGVLEVWITTGRDQAQIVRQMVTEFTRIGAETGDIEGYPAVNLKLIAGGTLLPATLAGMGPDVSMDGDPVSYGVRNAVLNLNDRKLHEEVNADGTPKNFTKADLDAVRTRFSPAAFIPLEVYNPDYKPVGDDLDEYYSVALYGLPETQSFPMMFYRKDIFAELQVEHDIGVPETWDDLYALIRVFSDKNMEIGLNTGLMQYIMYQNDVPWYKGDNVASEGMATNLDSDEALDAFETMCNFFTQFQQPYTYDFANRFRTGEMPLGIADYSLYNQLTVFAPEIKGLWEFVQLPGTERRGIAIATNEDGTLKKNEDGSYVKEEYTYIDHTVPAGVGAVMIMKDTDKVRAAWNYISWWTDFDAQNDFGNEQVAIIGTAAKYSTANVKAMKGQSWSSDEKRSLDQQFKYLEGTPMTPGNYIVGRNQNFAFLSVYNDGVTPSEAMQSYISDINKELSRKRDEYDFRIQEETLKEYQIEQEARLGVELKYLGKLADAEEAKAKEESK